MSQDTRKDPRAKVLTMTVRYKSATVDEFIEHHSYDVSRGGIFIKTPSPFPPGTLLKFEIKIADDKSVLQGVGRVVWKREAAGGTPDNPAGMGVKFIKIDDASKATIDRLVSTQDGPTAFDAENPEEKQEKPAPAAIPAPAPTPAPAALGSGGGFQRKGTMMGLGAVAKAAADTPAPSPAGQGFFPSTPITEAEMPPPAERTVMKQAAELLAEALKEAGGSFDEISDNPLFEAKPAEAKPVAAPAPVTSTARLVPLPAAEGRKPEPVAVAVAVSTPETPKRAAEERAAPVVAGAPRGSDPPSRRSSQSLPGPDSIPVEKGGGRTLLYMGIVAVIGVGAYFATQMGPAPVVPVPPVASTVAATTSAPAPVPVVSETAAPPGSVAAPTLSASAGGMGSASAKPAASEVPKTPDTGKPAKTAEVPPPVKPEVVKPPPPVKTETPPPVKTEAPPPPKPPVVKKPPAGGDDNPY